MALCDHLLEEKLSTLTSYNLRFIRMVLQELIREIHKNFYMMWGKNLHLTFYKFEDCLHDFSDYVS